MPIDPLAKHAFPSHPNTLFSLSKMVKIKHHILLFKVFFFLGRLKALFKSYSENDTLRLRAYSIKQWVFSIHAIKSTTLKHVLLADGLIYYLTYKYVKIQHSKKPHASVIPNTTTTIDQILCITWSMYMTIWKCRNKILSEK